VKPSSSNIPCLALRRLEHTYLLSSFTTTLLQSSPIINTNRSPCCHHHCRQCRVICCMPRSHHHNCRVYSCVWVLWYEYLCCQCVLWVLTSFTVTILPTKHLTVNESAVALRYTARACSIRDKSANCIEAKFTRHLVKQSLFKREEIYR
jgi:hypothetical protein